MKNPSLKEITNQNVISNILRGCLEEMLEIRGEKVVAFSYPGWDTADFISSLSSEISSAMYETGEGLGKSEFKKFNWETTKLTKEILEEMWVEASKKVGENLLQSFRGSEVDEIPGVEKALQEGSVIANGGFRANESDHRLAREKISANVEGVKFDREVLLRNFRNKYFEYMQKEFSLFDEEVGEEFKGEFKASISFK